MIPNLLLGALAVVAFLGLRHDPPFPLDVMEGAVLDVCDRMSTARTAGRTRVVIVDLDEGPRLGPQSLRYSLEALGESGVRVIGLDTSVQDKDLRTFPDEIRAFRSTLRRWSENHTGEKAGTGGVLNQLARIEKDLRSSSGIESQFEHPPPIVQAVHWIPQPRRARRNARTPEPNQLVPGPPDPAWSGTWRAGRIQAQVLFPASGALAMGHDRLVSCNVPRGRSHPLLLPCDGGLLPSFPLRMAMTFYRVSPASVEVRERELVVGDRVIPHRSAEMILPLGVQPGDLPRYSLLKILENPSKRRELNGKAVLVTRLGTPQATIFSSPQVQGPLLTAAILDALLEGRFLHRPPYLPWAELGALLLFMTLLVFFAGRFGELWSLFLFGGVIIIIAVGTLVLHATAGLWVRALCLFCGVTIFYLLMSFKRLLFIDTALRRSGDARRALGLNFERQGLLDLAFEQYRSCPPDRETLQRIYHLGKEYERRGKRSRALEAFEYVRASGGLEEAEKIKSTPIPAGERLMQPDAGDAPPRAEASADRRTVGRYRIVGRLGKGTMGLVYKGLDPKLNRPVAIKTIRFSDEFDSEQVQEIKERFLREAEIAGRLSHPAIVTIHDVGEDRDLTYMAMEYLEGKDLSHYAVKGRLLPLQAVVDVVARVAEAVDYAHSQEVIHRDIKPANIMLLKNGDVKVTDFGIAKAVSSSRTKTGVILGTPNYMSPEQIMGHRVDARTDIFSLGVLLFQLLTGRLPFHGENLSKLLYAITQEKHPSVKALNPEVPRACEQIIDKALAKRPSDRFESAGAMAHYLRILHDKIEEAMRDREGRGAA